MLKIRVGEGNFLKDKNLNPVVLCWKDRLKESVFRECVESFPEMELMLNANKFKGDLDQISVLTVPRGKDVVAQFIFAGLGPVNQQTHENLECLRRAVGWCVHKAKQLELKNIALKVINGFEFDLPVDELVSQVVVAAKMAEYDFDDYKTGKEKKSWDSDLCIFADVDSVDIERGIQKGLVISESVNWTRHLADMPPNVATPVYVARKAQEMAREVGLEVNVFGPEKAKELNMGGFLAVQSGSEFDGQFIELKYNCGLPGARTVAFVGKGVTFDSGGVSLKPANYMTGMKYDMSGAAATMGALKAIAQFKPKVNVVAVAPMVENMPGGGSYRQDDIVTHYNGKTTEIENTDAEGRLILADALAYVNDRHKPVCIIDLATLTGACVVALGHFFSGLMTNNQKLADVLIEHGKRTGDWLWQLPMHPFYDKAIKSKVADLSNCGSRNYGAGTITAAKFLQHFVGDTPWAHIDIAGTESSIPDSAYAAKLSSGVGVRLLVDFVLACQEKLGFLQEEKLES